VHAARALGLSVGQGGLLQALLKTVGTSWTPEPKLAYGYLGERAFDIAQRMVIPSHAELADLSAGVKSPFMVVEWKSLGVPGGS
jgi:hypothetical protein